MRGGPNTTGRATVILVLQTGQIIPQFNQAGAAGTRAADGIQRAARATGFWSRQLNVLGKALVSATVVLIAWNLTIAPIEGIFHGIVAAIGFAVQAFSDFEGATLSMQGILASTMEFSKDAGQNFAMAGEVAVEINKMMEIEARKTIATFEQLQQGMQTFIGAGGFSLVKSWEEGVKLNTLLVTGILNTTKGLGASRQIATELRALLTGTHIEGSQLAMALGLSKTEIKGMVEHARTNKDLFEVMSKLMNGIDRASVKFALSWEGIRSTIQDITTKFARNFITPTMQFISGKFEAFIEGWESIQLTINSLAASLGSVVLFTFEKIFNVASNLAKDILPKIGDAIIQWAVSLVGVITDFKNLLTAIEPFWVVIKAISTAIMAMGGTVFRAIPHIIELMNVPVIGGWEKAKPILDKIRDIDTTGTEAARARFETDMEAARVIINAKRTYLDAETEMQNAEKKLLDQKLTILQGLQNAGAANKALLGQAPPTRPQGPGEPDKALLQRRKAAMEFLQSLSEETLIAGDRLDKLNGEVTRDLHDLFRLVGEFPDLLPRGLELVRIRNMERIKKEMAEIQADMEQDAEQSKKKGTAAALATLQNQIEANRKAAEDFLRPFEMANQEVRLLFKQVSDIIRLMQLQRRGKVPRGLMPVSGTIEDRAKELMGELTHGKGAFGPSTQIENAMIIMGKRMEILKMAGAENTTEFKNLNAQYEKMQENLYELVDWQARLKVEMENTYFATTNTRDAIRSLVAHFAKLPGAMLDSIEMMKAFVGVMSNMFASVIAGEESFLQALKNIVGIFIEYVGVLVVNVATAAIAMHMMGGIFAKMAGISLPKAIAALAVGVTLMGLGRRLQGGGGGGGGKEAGATAGGGGGAGAPAPIHIPQRDILVQQGMNRNLQANTEAITGLNQEVGRLSKEKGDVLVSRTINQNPRIVTKPVTQLASRSYQTSKGMGGAVLGEA